VSTRKVFVFGLDGATASILDPMMAAGELPNLARLKAEGTSGKLLSTVHPITPAAWTSFATGLNPGKHGLYGFFRRRSDSYELGLVNARYRDGKPIWTVLSEQGKRVGVFNMPVTYPPERVNGFMVSGMDTPSADRPFTYPPRLSQDIHRAVGGYVIDVNASIHPDEEDYQTQVLHMLDKRVEALSYLLEEYDDLDFLLAVFVATDRLQHAFWKYIDPAEPSYRAPQAGLFRDGLIYCYRRLDEVIGEAMHQEATVMVLSDHGFGPLHKDVYLNKWLMDLGLLHFKEVPQEPGWSFLRYVDWERTKAYSYGYFGNIDLNLRGREPLGIVEKGKEAEELKDFLVQSLHQLNDPEDGRAIVDVVYRKERLYWGPHVDDAPDLLVVMRDYAYTTRAGCESEQHSLVGPPMQFQHILPHSGNHRMDGVLVMRGDGIRPGAEVEGASIPDIAPTILHLMGLPIPPDMDGKVLQDCLEDGHLKAHPVLFAAPDLTRPSRERRLEEEAERLEAHIERLQREIALKDREIALRDEQILARDRQIAAQNERIAALEAQLEAIRRGRAMRLLARVNRVLRWLRIRL